MKKLILAMACASLTLLAACGTVPQPSPGTTSPPTATDAVITQIQQDAVKVCGFLPTVETVAGIVATFVGAGPAVSLGSTVADAICGAVAPKASAKRKVSRAFRLTKQADGRPVINDVPVDGSFVR